MFNGIRNALLAAWLVTAIGMTASAIAAAGEAEPTDGYAGGEPAPIVIASATSGPGAAHERGASLERR